MKHWSNDRTDVNHTVQKIQYQRERVREFKSHTHKTLTQRMDIEQSKFEKGEREKAIGERWTEKHTHTNTTYERWKSKVKKIFLKDYDYTK